GRGRGGGGGGGGLGGGGGGGWRGALPRAAPIRSRLIEDLQHRTCPTEPAPLRARAPAQARRLLDGGHRQCVPALPAAKSAIIFFSSSCRPALSASRNAAVRR